MKTVKFFCDSNIVRLAKWLRFAGFDVITRKELSKTKIDYICQKDKRIFITRSKKRDIKLFKSKVEIILSEDIIDQIKQVMSKYPHHTELIASRCIVCNVKLRNTTDPSKDKYCPRCGRQYWKGTHYINMLKIINDNTSVSPYIEISPHTDI